MVFNIYFGMLVEHREWSPALFGVAMAVAIAAEVLALGAGARLLAWRSALSWLAPVFVISAIRWLATAWAPTPGVILAVQLAPRRELRRVVRRDDGRREPPPTTTAARRCKAGSRPRCSAAAA